tara:strand:+ start:30872 stop:31141 length:270 start_codon:yes stop_codon:yes gene_type:complete
MRVSNHEVPRAWAAGRAAESHTGNLWTDGQKIYSYRLCIGETMPSGEKLVLDYTAGGIQYYSQTTSCHVGRVAPYAHLIADGKEIRKIR